MKTAQLFDNVQRVAYFNHKRRGTQRCEKKTFEEKVQETFAELLLED